MTDTRPIGILDSGFGGLSVARAVAELLPQENLVYAADCGFAPWGDRTDDFILERTHALVSHLLRKDVKAIVIACNTATSVAAEALRAENPHVPIVGIEPALKPATQEPGHGLVLVMATQITLRLDKYHELARACGAGDDVVSVPCPGLAARIERGDLDADDLRDLLEGYLGGYAGRVGSVVLGCTHYPFVRRQIARVLGPGVRFFDGGEGTARQLRARLGQEGLLSPRARRGEVCLASSLDTPEELALYREFLSLPL